MQQHKALLLILSFRFAELSCAASSRNDASGAQQLEASTEQPRRLAVDSSNGAVSLLSIMRHLQSRPRPNAAVASEIQLERRDLTGQSSHERQLLTDMGHLEGQLESWKEAEQTLEQQVQQQAATVQSLKLEEARAAHDEQFAEVVWWDCKMLMCAVIITGLLFCIYTSQKPDALAKPSFNAADMSEPAVAQIVRRARPQPEFIEKDVEQQMEDTLQVNLAMPHPTLAENPNLEAHTARTQAEDVYDFDVSKLAPLPISSHEKATEHVDEGDSTPNSARCQYFNLAEEPVAHVSTSAEENWWNESTSGY